MPQLRAPDGSIVSVPDEQVSQLTAGGYQPVTLGEAGAVTSAPEAPTSGGLAPIGAAASSFLSGATLGGSDWAFKGLLDPGAFERLRADREAHPIVSGIGQVAGAVVGGPTPAGYLSRATGALAEGGGVAAKLGASAIEGGVQNAGAYLADTALGDRDLSAEGLVGALGTGMEFGAGAGGVALGIERGTIAARRLFSRVAGTAKEAQAAEQAWAAKYQTTIEAHDAAADVARAKLAEASLARQQAQLVQQRTAADLAEARIPRPAGTPEAVPPSPGAPAAEVAAGAPVAALGAPSASRRTTAPSEPPAVEAARLLHDRAMQISDVEVRAWDTANGPRLQELLGPQAALVMPTGAAAGGSVALGEAAEKDMATALAEHDAARTELEDLLARIEAPDVGRPGRAIGQHTVPIGEFPPDLARGTSLGSKAPGSELAPPSEAGTAVIGPRSLRGGAKGTPVGQPEALSLGEAATSGTAVGRSRPAPTGEPTRFTVTDRAAGGSQGGKWYADEHGQQWFGKHYGGDTDRIEGEHLANQVYRMFGVDAPETRIADVGGKRVLMSREVPGSVATSAEDIAATNAKDGFVLDAWLANHDVVGTGYDNVIVAGPKAVRIDNGGATIWRAQGESKEFKALVSELDSMRDPQRYAGRAFAGLTNDQVDAQVQRFASEYPAKKGAIDRLIDGSALSRKAKEQIKTGLHDRAAWLIGRAKGNMAELSDGEFSQLADAGQSVLTDKQRETAMAYTRQGLYAQLNAPLREMAGRAGGGGLKPVAEHLHEVVQRLDEAVAASPAPRDMIVSRGVNGRRSTAALSGLKPGDVYVDPGFVSTSYSAEIGSDYAKGFDVRKGVELKISVPQGYPALAIPSEFPKEREILLGRGGRFIVTGREVGEDGRVVLHMVLREPDAFDAVKLPEGFVTNAKDSRGHAMFVDNPDVAFGVPEYNDIPNIQHSRSIAYIVKPSELAEVGITGKAKTAAEPWNGSLDLPAIEVSAHRGEAFDPGGGREWKYKTSGYSIDDGAKRLLAAAADGDRPVLVRFFPSQRSFASMKGESLVGDIRAAVAARARGSAVAADAAAPATDSLTGQLRGTASKLAAGEDVAAMGAPARAGYLAAKEGRAAEAAERFRGEALAGRAERAGLGNPDAPWNEGFGPTAGGYEGSRMAAEERAGLAEHEASRAARGAKGEHPMAVKQLEAAHDAALEREASAATPGERAAASREAQAIERQLTAVGARPGAVEDVAAVAAIVTKYEKASARLTEALGADAPPAAQEAAKAVRAAEAEVERKTVARTTRAIEAHAADPVTSAAEWNEQRMKQGLGDALAPPPKSPGGGNPEVASAKAAKLRADADLARARAAETEAKIGAGAAKRQAAETRATVEAARPAAVEPGAPSKLGSIATALGVAAEVGIPGLPHPKDIPLIGPLLSMYLKYRAVKATAGRFVGRIPATGDARAAALVARTKDRIAVAVDRTLGLAAEVAPKARGPLVATAVVLGRRVFDDGQPDAPKGASEAALAAVRIREISTAATRPDLVEAMVRRRLGGVTDPDLIDAAAATVQAQFKYLASTMPKAPPPNPYTKTQWVPSAGDTADLARRIAVAHDPEAAFTNPTPAGADALNNFYPKLAEFAQQRLAERAADLKNPVEYHQLVRASIVFQIPLHVSLQPENAALLRASFSGTPSGPSAGAPPGPGAPPGAPPPPSIAGPANINQLYQTSADRRAQR